MLQKNGSNSNAIQYNATIMVCFWRIFQVIQQRNKYLWKMYAQHRGTGERSWLGHYATNRKVAGWIPDEVIEFFNLPNPSSRTMALVSTQPVTEMSTRNLPEGTGRPARKTDNLTIICEPIVY
jgi:hypothetical protein